MRYSVRCAQVTLVSTKLSEDILRNAKIFIHSIVQVHLNIPAFEVRDLLEEIIVVPAWARVFTSQHVVVLDVLVLENLSDTERLCTVVAARCVLRRVPELDINGGKASAERARPSSKNVSLSKRDERRHAGGDEPHRLAQRLSVRAHRIFSSMCERILHAQSHYRQRFRG